LRALTINNVPSILQQTARRRNRRDPTPLGAESLLSRRSGLWGNSNWKKARVRLVMFRPTGGSKFLSATSTLAYTAS
jgi:hypothetical protein